MKYLANCKFNVEQLARYLKISRPQLVRKFKALIDCAPNSFVRDARLKRAVELLRDSQLTALEITNAFDFCDAKYLGRCFGKIRAAALDQSQAVQLY